MRRTAIEASCLRQAYKTRDACVSFRCMLQTSRNEVIKLRKLERHATEYTTCSVIAVKILSKTLSLVFSCSNQLLKSAREDTNTRQMVNQRIKRLPAFHCYDKLTKHLASDTYTRQELISTLLH